MCPQSIMKRDRGYMSWEVFKKAVDEASGHCKTSYLHQIGEPLLHPEIIQMINYAEDKGIRTSISTNCLLLDERMSVLILDSKLKEITLCLDSLDPATYEKIRKNSDFKKVMENISRFLNMRPGRNNHIHVQVQMIKMKENEREWDSFKIGKADEILVKSYSTFAGNVVKGEHENGYRHGCKKAWNCLTIQWNGDMVLCCRDFDGVTKIGNIQTDSIVQVWNGQKYKDIRQAFINKNFNELPFCSKC
jgi:radical SAM protein with 4Fe4S-binding SPASM domain